MKRITRLFILLISILLILSTCSKKNPESPINRLGDPQLASYSNSNCLGSPMDKGEELSDEMIVKINGNNITVIHQNAVYNCCIDKIEVTLSISGNILKLIEKEIVGMPCACVCTFDIESVINNLSKGDYIIQIWNADQTELLAEKEISI